MGVFPLTADEQRILFLHFLPAHENTHLHSTKAEGEEILLPDFVIKEIKLPLNNLFCDTACAELICLNVTWQ